MAQQQTSQQPMAYMPQYQEVKGFAGIVSALPINVAPKQTFADASNLYMPFSPTIVKRAGLKNVKVFDIYNGFESAGDYFFTTFKNNDDVKEVGEVCVNVFYGNLLNSITISDISYQMETNLTLTIEFKLGDTYDDLVTTVNGTVVDTTIVGKTVTIHDYVPNQDKLYIRVGTENQQSNILTIDLSLSNFIYQCVQTDKQWNATQNHFEYTYTVQGDNLMSTTALIIGSEHITTFVSKSNNNIVFKTLVNHAVGVQISNGNNTINVTDRFTNVVDDSTTVDLTVPQYIFCVINLTDIYSNGNLIKQYTKKYIGTGITEYDPDIYYSFNNIQNNIICTNGVTNVGVINMYSGWYGINFSEFNEILDPVTLPTLNRNNVGTGDVLFKACYSFVGGLGTTKASQEAHINIDIEPLNWVGNQGVNLVVNRPAWGWGDAKFIEAFCSSGNSSQLIFGGMTSIDGNPDSVTVFITRASMNDIGTTGELGPALENTTKDIKPLRSYIQNNKVYMWGDKSKPYRLWYGGNNGNEMNIASSLGGGYIDINSREQISDMLYFKKDAGTGILCLTTFNPQTGGSHYLVQDQKVQESSESYFVAYTIEETDTQIGCSSHYGMIVMNNACYYPSITGHVVRAIQPSGYSFYTKYNSDNIWDYWQALPLEILKEQRVSNWHSNLFLYSPNYDAIEIYNNDYKAWMRWHMTDIDGNKANVQFMSQCELDGHDWQFMVLDNKFYLLDYDQPYDEFTEGDANSRRPIHFYAISTAINAQDARTAYGRLVQLRAIFSELTGGRITLGAKGLDYYGRYFDIKNKLNRKRENLDYNYQGLVRVDRDVKNWQYYIEGKDLMTSFEIAAFDDQVIRQSQGMLGQFGIGADTAHDNWRNAQG